MNDKEFWNSMVPELTVMHFDISLNFYTNILGFVVRYSRLNPDFAYLTLGKAHLMLEEFHERGWYTAQLKPPLGRGLNLQIEVDNVNCIYTLVLNAGITPLRSLQKIDYVTGKGDHYVQTEFLVEDPDGYLLRFCQIDDSDE